MNNRFLSRIVVATTLVPLCALLPACSQQRQRSEDIAQRAPGPTVTVGFHPALEKPMEEYDSMDGPDGRAFFVSPETVIETRDIEEAHVADDGRGGSCIRATLTKAGGRRMLAYTQAHQGEWLAIVVDGRLVTAAQIHSTLERQVQISGHFTRDEAERIANALNRRG